MSAFRTWPGRFGRFEKSFLIAAFCGFTATASFAEGPQDAAPSRAPVLRVPLSNDWKIEIVPGPSSVPKAELAARQAAQSQTNPAANDPSSGIVTAGAESALPAGITPAAYAEVYNSIPFRRSEYLANRNYRHEATIEILLGQVRPKTVVNVTAPSTTCCSPLPATLVRWFSPWGTNAFDYRYSRYRP